jgi:ATP-dependent helicase/nuclease subunit B
MVGLGDRRGNVGAIDMNQGRDYDSARQCAQLQCRRAPTDQRRHDGSYAILDYKTGSHKPAAIADGTVAQLTLEAAILREGGFGGIDAGSSVGELVYIRLSGNNPPGEQRVLELKINQRDVPQPPDAAADEARNKLENLIRAFEDESQAYTSLNLSMWSNRYGSYDDLARIKEWSAAGGLGIEEW